jgi:hypothetical protein
MTGSRVRLSLWALVFGTSLSCTSPTAPAPTGPNATITGTVVERVDGAPYSFLKLETTSGMTWVAVPMAEVPKRSKVVVKNGAVLKDFESKQAGRKFDAVVFGVLEKG